MLKNFSACWILAKDGENVLIFHFHLSLIYRINK